VLVASFAVTESQAHNVKYVVVAILMVLTIVQMRAHPVSVPELWKRVPRCVAGLCLFGIGISMFFRGTLGTGPWDVLHGGLAKLLGVPPGLVINVVGLLVLPLWIPLKQRVGLGTVLNTLLIGIVVDLVRPRLHDAHVLWLRLILAGGGTIVIGLGSALYIGAGLGAGPRDGIMVGLNRLGLSVRAGRTLVEVVTLVVGYLLGGKIGAGTVMFLVGIGPTVQYLLPKFTLPSLSANEKIVSANEAAAIE
jgi:uncharacterized membrane protein YczE